MELSVVFISERQWQVPVSEPGTALTGGRVCVSGGVYFFVLFTYITFYSEII